MPRFRKKLEPEDRNVTDPERARKKTFDRAVNLLTYKPRSEAELRERLLEKPWTDEEIVESVIETLRKYNYINDLEYARSFAASRLRQKPIGRYRLSQELKRKKIDSGVAEQALEYAYSKLPEEDLIGDALEKRLRTKGLPRDHSDRKKIFDHLVRLGFDYDLIRSKVDGLRYREEEDGSYDD